MMEQPLDIIRTMPRETLEELAVEAVVRVHRQKHEQEASASFVLVLGGFMSGVLVAAAGFMAGSLLP